MTAAPVQRTRRVKQYPDDCSFAEGVADRRMQAKVSYDGALRHRHAPQPNEGAVFSARRVTPPANCSQVICLRDLGGREIAGQHVRTPNQDIRSALSRASMTLFASVVLEPATLAEFGSFFAFSSFLVPLPFFPIFSPFLPKPPLWHRYPQERDSGRIRSVYRQPS